MGIQQKAFGDLFEQIFFQWCVRTPGIAITRFPDGCKVLPGGRVVRIKTPWDWIVTFGGVTALIDTKTTDSSSFPHSKIEAHQVEGMLSHCRSGARCGYVVWFRKTDDIFFFSAETLFNLVNKRGSIKCDHQMQGYLGKTRDFKVRMIFGI